MATTNKYFKVKNGLDINSNATVDASGNANIAGNLTANTGFVSADTFRLDTTYAGGSAVVGEFSWDPDNETARLLLDGVNLQIGQEHIIRVKNASGSVAIPDRTPVMFAGATGDTVTVSPAVSSNVAVYPSDYMVGITTEEIPADGFGFVTQFGFINQVNTTAWTVGTLLYVDPATAGGLTSTRPSAPAWQTPIAAVTKQNGSAGRLLVRTIPGIAINHVEGVEITSATTNDILRINSSGIVVNSNLSSANIANLASATTQTFTGNIAAANISSTGIISGSEFTSTNSSGPEGGQLNLAKPATTSLSGNVIVDIYENKIRFFDSAGTNRGAYIDLTAAGAGVGTNLLGGVTGAMNYAQTEGTKQSAVSAAGTTIVSVSITTNGYPILVTVTGDVENNSAGGWTVLQLYRDSTAIGNPVHTEGSAGSENVPYALSVIDTPSAGTYTYALKLNNSAGGTFNFGESDGPVITAIELSGPKGDAGANGTGATYTVSATNPGTGANLTLTGSDSSTDAVKFIGSGSTTVSYTDANTITISSTGGTGTTYNVSADSVSGGANITLNGSDASTDAVTILGGNATTVTYANANAITINTIPVVSSSTAPSSYDVLWIDTGNSASSFLSTSTFTTKGDILTASASNTAVRLGVGADGTFLSANSSAAYGLNWSTIPLKVPISTISSGYYYPTLSGSTSTTATTATTTVFLSPYLAMTNMTVSSVSVNVGNPGTGASFRLGLYAADVNGLPAARLYDFGTISSASTGPKSITGLSVPIVAGTYYYFAAIPTSSSSSGLSGVSNILPQLLPFGRTSISTTQGVGLSFTTGSAGTLPSTAVGASFTEQTFAHVFWLGVGV